MRRQLIEHIGSIGFVALIFVVIVLSIEGRQETAREDRTRLVAPYLALPSLDLGNPRDRALLKETLNLFHPDTRAGNDSLIRAIEDYRQAQFVDPEMKADAGDRGLTWPVVVRLTGMYIQFILVYAIVLGLTFYAAQSLAMYRFVRLKQGLGSYGAELLQQLRTWGRQDGRNRTPSRWLRFIVTLLKAITKGIAYVVLFSPAYVIGYAVKTSVDTDSLLVNYANKFYTLLVAESKKGYVETALAKNLSASYRWNVPEGISTRSILLLPRHFPGHVFQHIYLNARYQYLPTLKEQASFLISGLIIIEMALNIQGHLCYELLQTLLYKQYDVAMAIVLGIFLLVKVTEMLVDARRHKEEVRYGNRD